MRHFCPARSSLIPLEVNRLGESKTSRWCWGTQYPRDYARTIRKEMTKWICFNINEPDNLNAVRPYFPGVDAVAELPRGGFIAINRESGATMRGRLFQPFFLFIVQRWPDFKFLGDGQNPLVAVNVKRQKNFAVRLDGGGDVHGVQ